MATQFQLEKAEDEILEIINKGQYFELYGEDEITIEGNFTLDQVLNIAKVLLTLESE